MKCDHEGCCLPRASKDPTMMHVTCGRQAGFEVRFDDQREVYFYGTFLFKDPSIAFFILE